MDNKNKIYICETCTSCFSTKENLTYHRKRAMYCLKLREKERIDDKFECKCGKIFSYKSSYKKHVFVCKFLKDQEIEEKNEEIILLQEIESEALKGKNEDIRYLREVIKRKNEKLRKTEAELISTKAELKRRNREIEREKIPEEIVSSLLGEVEFEKNEKKRLQDTINVLTSRDNERDIISGLLEKYSQDNIWIKQDTLIAPLAKNFDKAFREKCIEEFDTFEGISTLNDVVDFFICMTVSCGGFNYVIKDASRNKFGYFIDGMFRDDFEGEKAILTIKQLLYKVLEKDISSWPKTENKQDREMSENHRHTDLHNDVPRINNILKKKLPKRLNMKSESYKEDCRGIYTLSKFTKEVCEEYEEIDFKF